MNLPSNDRFYDSVGHAPAAPGRLLRSRPVHVPGTIATTTQQVVYVTTATHGELIPVSGTLFVPDLPWRGPGPRPVVSYGVGVHGLGRDGAPSHLLVTGTEPELGLIEQVLARGWIVAVTDGEGLGMPGPHTYGAGLVGGRAMLDIVRAARGAVGNVTTDSPLLLWGYSEGGRCAAWAAEQQPVYAPELNLLAVAAGGVPSDLSRVVQTIDGGPFSGLGLAVLVGLAQAHRDPRLWEILNERGRAAADLAATLDVTGLVLAHPEPMAAYTVRERPWEEPTWRALLRAERNPQATPEVPVYLYHASADEIVPVALSRELAAAYERRGTPVSLVETGSSDHLSGAQDGAAQALAWLDDRLRSAEAAADASQRSA